VNDKDRGWFATEVKNLLLSHLET